MAKKEAEEFPQEGTPEYEAFINQQTSTELLATTRQRTLSMVTADGHSTVSAVDLKGLTLSDLEALLGCPVELGSDQYGPILEDKSKLVGVPFVAVYWEFHESKQYGRSFVSMMVQTLNGDKYIVNDGSTGIFQQLLDLTEKTGQNSMLACRKGFRVSVYDKELPNGSTIKDAETYYIDTKL